MNPESSFIRFTWPEPGSFWRWSPDAEAVTWADGSTLAFYQEIELTLRRLQPYGFPRFEEILLVLAATHKNWANPGGGAEQLARHLDAVGSPAPLLLENLNRAHELVTTPDAGPALLEAVFARNGDHLDSSDAAAILDLFRLGTAAARLREHAMLSQTTPEKLLTQGLVESIQNVIQAFRDLDPDADLDHLAKTGLQTPLSAAGIDDLPLVERIRALVTRLAGSDDSELAGLARVAQNLSAVVSLPRPASEPHDLPLGGYSDIANRGALDRLLVSELAQDPDILAVRVALNEALYLRRESPPRQPARRRAILVDVGIRLWGVPRVFAHSVALAFAMQAGRDARIEIFTARDGNLAPASLDHAKGLVDLLGRLSPSPHPGAALAEFLKQFVADDEVGTDCIFITTPAVWADREFQKAIAAEAAAEFYVATVDREGRYELFTRSPAGTRQLHRARLDLNRLLAASPESSSRAQQLLSQRSGRLPLILRQHPFPLRLAVSAKLENSLYDPASGLIAHTNDGHLVRWPKPDRGATLITDSFPRGLVQWSHLDSGERAMFLIPKSGGQATLAILDLKSDEFRTTDLDHGIEYLRHASFLDGVVVLVGDEQISVHRTPAGEKVSAHPIERCRRGFDRFLRFATGWTALGQGVDGIQFEPVPKVSAVDQFELVWESADWPAPLALFRDLSVICLTEPPERVTESGGAFFQRLVSMSGDRARLVVDAKPLQSNATRSYSIDLQRREVGPKSDATQWRFEPDASRIFERCPAIRNRYKSVAATADGRLILLSARGTPYALECVTEGVPRLQWARLDGALPNGAIVAAFDRVASPKGARFKLKRATLPDGGTAWLDQRGFLHLKSSEKSIPEVTLCLKDGMVSAWTSAGEFVGNSYFIGDRQPDHPASVFASVSRFVAKAFANQLAHA